MESAWCRTCKLARTSATRVQRPLFISCLILVQRRPQAPVSVPSSSSKSSRLGVCVLQKLIERRIGLPECVQFLTVAVDLLPEALI